MASGEEQASSSDRWGLTMIDYLENAKRYLWLFVELGFATVLSIMLLYLILGENAGAFVTSVADNVIKFAGAVPTPSLVGLAIVGALIYLIAQRFK
jgi:hypothetical protein